MKRTKVRQLGRIACMLALQLACLSEGLVAQANRQIKGTVTDYLTQETLSNVNISVKGTDRKVISDGMGGYVITVGEDQILVFSYVGYETVEVAISEQSVVDVQLQMLVSSLEELVVTGYSTQRKKDITGSVSVIQTDNLQKVFSRSTEEALQGMASGVNVIKAGAPGAKNKILIRGITSFGDTEPLVIVDGIEQNLNNISAADVESIQVLKDAGSAAIYGVRGANGVILVTTKKGKTGAPKVNYEGSVGMQYPLGGNPYNLLNPFDYMSVYNLAYPGNPSYINGMPDYTYRGPGGAGVAFEGDPAVDPSLYFLEIPNQGNNYVIQKVNKEGTDWFHELFKPALTTAHSANVSGATDKSNYLFSLGYLNQQGTLVESDLKRYSARINTEFKIGEYFKIGENINILFRDVGQVYAGTTPYTLQAMVPLKDIMGNWAGGFGGPAIGSSPNPVGQQIRHEHDINNQWHIMGNGYAELSFLKNFTARTSLGYNINNFYSHQFSPTAYEGGEINNQKNMLTIGSGFGSTMTFTNTVNYSQIFGGHSLHVLAGTEAIANTGRSQTGLKQNFFSDDPNFQVLDNGQEGMQNYSTIAKSTLFSIFGRVDYAFKDRYLLSGTLRGDGSSRFGPGRKYGVFPSVSAGWRLSEEPFLADVSWLDDLKVRGSYGVLGSQNNVNQQNQYSLYYSAFGLPNTATDHNYDLAGTGNSVVQGFGAQRIGNAQTGWEENIISNVGFDAMLLNGSLELAVEYYKKSIRGLLFTEPLPAVLGDVAAPQINIGNIQNKGVDAMIKYKGGIGKQFSYFASANITSYHNEVIHVQNPGYFDSGVVRNQVGHPVSSFFGYKVLGLFNSDEEVADAPTQQAAAPGRFRYLDSNDDGMIGPDDRIHLGSPNPDFTYGVNLGAEYKNFDFSAFFYGSQGNEIYSSVRRGLDFFGYYPQWNKSRNLLNAWTPENTNTSIPKIESAESFSTSGVNSSYFVEDGSFLKLRTVVLGYTLSADYLNRIKVSRLRVYAQAANLFTITGYSGLDPEIGGGSAAFGIDNGGYPTDEMSVSLGLSLTF